MDSMRNKTTENDIFSPDFKKRMMKGFISRFNLLSHLVPVDSLHFKPGQIRKEIVLTKEDEIFRKNSIIQYFIIEGEIMDYLHFAFEEGGTRLISIVISEPQGEKGLKLSNYLKQVSKAQ